MAVDGVWAQGELLGDVGVREAAGDERQDLALAPAQLIGRRATADALCPEAA
jgi:hypothetical protein